MYILRQEVTVFGSKNDIQLMSLAVVKNHCTVTYHTAQNTVSITAGSSSIIVYIYLYSILVHLYSYSIIISN